MKKIIYKTENGVAVITPATNVSIDDCVKDVPRGVDYRIINETALPTNRIFRNAWEIDGKFGIKINTTKAQKITKDRIRLYRKPLLEQLDTEILIALETDADIAEIIAKKQVLRDMPETADGKSVGELEKILSALDDLEGSIPVPPINR